MSRSSKKGPWVEARLMSRIEALNKTLSTSLLLSKDTRDALQRSVELRALPPQAVKGVDQPVEIFTVAA